MMSLGSRELVSSPNPWRPVGCSLYPFPFCPVVRPLMSKVHGDGFESSSSKQSWRLSHCSQRSPSIILVFNLLNISSKGSLFPLYRALLWFVFRMYWGEGRGIYNAIIITPSVCKTWASMELVILGDFLKLLWYDE